MAKHKMVFFVSFETTLETNQFISQWENYTSSNGNQNNIILQQTGSNGKYKYIAQYLCDADEFQFVISKAVRTNRQAITEVRIKQLGGYAFIKHDKKPAEKYKEAKVLIFLTDPQADLSIYKNLPIKTTLNIYQGYYENCSYAYILEFIIKASKVAELVTQLELCNEKNIEVYKECRLPVSNSVI